MKPTRWIALFGVATIATVLLTASSRERAPQAWDAAGTYIQTDMNGSLALVAATPLDPTGKRLNTVSHDFQGDPAFYGMFPDAVARTPFRGEMVETAKNVLQGSSVAFATNADRDIVYTMVASYTIQMTGPNSSESVEATLAIYGPEQDPFGEEPPLYGCFPYQYSFERVPIVPLCEL